MEDDIQQTPPAVRAALDRERVRSHHRRQGTDVTLSEKTRVSMNIVGVTALVGVISAGVWAWTDLRAEVRELNRQRAEDREAQRQQVQAIKDLSDAIVELRIVVGSRAERERIGGGK